MKNGEKVFTRNVCLTDTDICIAKALGGGNVSQGIKDALRLAIKLNQVGHDEL